MQPEQIQRMMELLEAAGFDHGDIKKIIDHPLIFPSSEKSMIIQIMSEYSDSSVAMLAPTYRKLAKYVASTRWSQ